MEKKKLQRIIGILVVVALVIVLIPLLFSKKDAPPEPQQVTALIAPEQQSSPATAPEASPSTVAQNNTNDSAVPPTGTTDTNNTTTTAASTNTINSNEQDNGITPIASAESNTQGATPATATPTNPADANNAPAPSTQAHPVAQDTGAINPANAASSANNTSQQPATQGPHSNVKYTGNTVEVAPVPADSNAPAQNTEEITPAVATAINDTVYPEAKAEKTAAINTPTTKEVKPRHTHTSVIAKKVSSFSEKDLANLKKPAWVVQMGSFKDKSNAHRLVDQLRTAGFKAFTHEVTSSAGTVRTRVYIGPEFKEASALTLSTQVEQAVKLRGFVVPYKPLAL